MFATPRDVHAVGQVYRDVRQTTDDEVIELLARSRDDHAPASRPAAAPDE